MYSPLVKNSLSYQCCFRTMLFQGNEIFMPVQVCTNVWSNKLLFRHCVLPFLSIYFKHWNSQAAKKVWLTHAKKKTAWNWEMQELATILDGCKIILPSQSFSGHHIGFQSFFWWPYLFAHLGYFCKNFTSFCNFNLCFCCRCSDQNELYLLLITLTRG